jgi:hypothetical protein
MTPALPWSQPVADPAPNQPDADGDPPAHDDAVDHERAPGVPPPDNDDLTGYDAAVAESFPASDPPQHA